MTSLRTKILPNEIPQEIEVPITIYYKIAGWQQGTLGVWAMDADGDSETIILYKTTVSVFMDTKEDFTKLAITSLQNSVQALQADTWKKVTEMQRQIERLQQITHQPEVLDDEIPY